MKKTA